MDLEPSKTWSIVTMCLIWISTTSARAQSVDESVRFEPDEEYQVVGRTRVVGVPDLGLNAMYDHHASSWQSGEPSLAYGLEFIWRKVDAFELSVAAEYADLGMPGAYWKRGNADLESSEYVDFNLAMLSLTFSSYWYWDATRWLSPYLGGGLGIGYLLGDVTTYAAASGSACRDALANGADASYPPDACRLDSTSPEESEQLKAGTPEERLWPVAPVVNLTLGLRFNIREHGVLKLEGGIYDYWFVGLSGGTQW